MMNSKSTGFSQIYPIPCFGIGGVKGGRSPAKRT
ncbi:hypothetical protein RCH08_002366, partial [Janthinobacterium sp. CG_S6]|nr:hypothetical protein [Janthinobacterium sp. CG_S6]